MPSSVLKRSRGDGCSDCLIDFRGCKGCHRKLQQRTGGDVGGTVRTRRTATVTISAEMIRELKDLKPGATARSSILITFLNSQQLDPPPRTFQAYVTQIVLDERFAEVPLQTPAAACLKCKPEMQHDSI